MSKKLLDLIKRVEIQNASYLPKTNRKPDDPNSDVAKWLVEFDQAWIDQQDTSRAIEDDGFHPSSLGIKAGNCGRRNVYLLRGVPKKANFPARVLRIFANGHGVHERLQSTMSKMEHPFEDEVKIEWDEPPVRGHCDGVLVYNDRKILIEIKSCSSTVFNNRLDYDRPRVDHVAQASIYAHVLGIGTIWIIYECKDTQRIKVFEVEANREASQKILDKWHSEWLAFKDGKLPARPYKEGSPTCADCDLIEHCWSDTEISVSLKPYKDKVKEINKKKEELNE